MQQSKAWVEGLITRFHRRIGSAGFSRAWDRRVSDLARTAPRGVAGVAAVSRLRHEVAERREARLRPVFWQWTSG